MIKKLFIIILFYFFTNSLFSKESVIITLIINNKPITNVDILNEANYLIALNPRIQKLSKK